MNKPLQIDAELIEVRKIAPWLKTLSGEDEFDRSKVELALVELCNNIIEHGYRQQAGAAINITFSRMDIASSFVVTDEAPPFELPDASGLPEEATVHGYGLHIIRKLCAGVALNRAGNVNVWTLLFEHENLSAPEKQPTTKLESDLIQVSDRLDVVSAPELRARLDGELQAGRKNLIADLSSVEFCDSAGLAALVAAMKKTKAEGGHLQLIRPTSDDAFRVFQLTKFDEIFDFVEST